MASVTQPLAVGQRLFDIPGAPIVGRDITTGRFTKLSDEIVAYYKHVAADALNDYADKIARASLVEVPKGPRGEGHAGLEESSSLAASLRAPFNDPEARATDEELIAEISYDTHYAAPQHEGVWTMVHHHPIIPGREGFFEKTGETKAVTIEWHAEHYTTPGTKDHYLEDPFKAYASGFEAYMYSRVRAAFTA